MMKEADGKQRRYRVHKYTEYIVKSYVEGEDGEWEWETDVSYHPKRVDAVDAAKDYRSSGFPADQRATTF